MRCPMARREVGGRIVGQAEGTRKPLFDGRLLRYRGNVHSHTQSSKRTPSSEGTRKATRELPASPAPVTVTRRDATSNATSSATSLTPDAGAGFGAQVV